MELLDLYTEDRVRTGKTMVRGTVVPEGLCRLVVHVCIFDSQGRMLIQQRQPFKSGWSNYWDMSVGGCAVAGDTSIAAAERETREEIGSRSRPPAAQALSPQSTTSSPTWKRSASSSAWTPTTSPTWPWWTRT